MTSTDRHAFPEIQGGGSLILAWQIKNKTVLVVGGGEVRNLYYISSIAHPLSLPFHSSPYCHHLSHN